MRREIVTFIWSFVSHWQTYVTGGSVTALITVWERLRNKNLPTRAYFLIFVVTFSIVGFFMAWREQYERAEGLHAKLNQQPQQATVQIQVPPPTVIYPPPERRRAALSHSQEPRNRMHVLNFEMLTTEDTIAANVFVQNIGPATVTAKVFEVMAFGTPNTETEEQLEKDIRVKLDQDAATTTDLPKTIPGSAGIWFTHQGVRISSEQMTDFRKGTLQYVFAGVIVYNDSAGTHRTYYCASNAGNPKVIVMCSKNNEEI
jgi:hypothetical protein